MSQSSTSTRAGKFNPLIAAGVLIAAIVCFLGLIKLGATGLRGSDQYWYTAEVETLLAGQPRNTNFVYPFHAANGYVPPPFNHHTLAHYLILPFARVLGAYSGWILFNGLATLIGASVVALLVLKLSCFPAAAFAFVLSLLAPIAFWTTAQPYLEAFLAGLISVGLYLFVIPRDSALKWLLLFVVILTAYFCRLSYLPLLLLVPIGCWYYQRSSGRRKFTLAALLTLLCGIALYAMPRLLPSDPALGLSRYIDATVPGESDNLHVLYSLNEPSIEAGRILRKIQHGLYQQIAKRPLMLQLFYLPFNILAVLALLFCFRTNSSAERRVALGIGVVLIIHAAIIFLRANEFRFLMSATPPLIVGATLFLAKRGIFERSRMTALLLLGTLVLLIGFDVRITQKLQHDVRHDDVLREELAATVKRHIPEDESLILEAQNTFRREEVVLGYVLRPRLVLLVRRSYQYTDEQIGKMQQNMQASWLLAPEDSPLLGQLSVSADDLELDNLPAPFSDFGLYRIAALE